MMPLDLFEQAVISMKGYYGVVAMFGGNPCMHPQFPQLCEILRKHIPNSRQRGLWSNNPITLANAKVAQLTFNPHYSNINVHMDQAAFDLWRKGWPECFPFGLKEDSRHSPVWVAMKDVIADEGKRWEIIANCDINHHWSPLIGMFRGKLRAWFCEIAGAQSMLHQYEPDFPDTGLDPTLSYNGLPWWQLQMPAFAAQARKHCHECSVPLHGYGELAVSNQGGTEQYSKTHESIFKPKKKDRKVQEVTELVQLNLGKINNLIDYMGNAKK